MKYRRFRAAAFIIACVILASFVLSAPHTRDIVEESPALIATTTVQSSVAIRDVFKKGTHTITGSLSAPNLCTSLTATTTLVDKRIQVNISMPEDVGVCLQEISMLKFSTSVVAPVNTPIDVLVNGVTATTTSL
jgi:hypothetical protein